MLNTFKIRSKPWELLARVTALSAAQYSFIFYSNNRTLGPLVIHPDLKTSTTAFTSCSVISGGEKGITRLFIVKSTSKHYYITQFWKGILLSAIFLENANLGTKVFVRLSGGLKLTEAGEILLSYSQKILSLVDDSRKAIVGNKTLHGKN